MHQIASGDFPVASILALAPKKLVSVRAILFEKGVVTRTQQILINMEHWTFATLRSCLLLDPAGLTRVLGSARSWAPEEKLSSLKTVVEGSTLEILDVGLNPEAKDLAGAAGAPLWKQGLGRGRVQRFFDHERAVQGRQQR